MQLRLGLAQIELHANGVANLHLELRQDPLRKHDRVIVSSLRTLESKDRYGRLWILLRGPNKRRHVAKNRVSVGALGSLAEFHLMSELVPWQVLVIAVLVNLKVGACCANIDQKGRVEPLFTIVDGAQLAFETGG